jgi:NTE family protein
MLRILFCFFSIFLLMCQPQLLSQRPKVGLALSGGGAKGLAHIGILKAIDSAGLKIDYITGTSMGAIIGAMYAAGYSGREIEEKVMRLNWDDLLNGRPRYSQVGIEEKDEIDNYTAELPFRKRRPILSTGFLESEELWLTFSELFFPVHHIKDFSEFNIPFQCLATDLSSGRAVILNHGEIVWAVRSSMALPSVFSATTYGDTKLVDGGIVRNFPVSDVKVMGADYLIGVNLYAGLSEAKDLRTMLDVMYQITNFRDAEDLNFEKGLCNILIEPPMTTYSAASFNNTKAIMEIGNHIGEQYYSTFKQLSDSLNAIEHIDYDPLCRLQEQTSVVIDGIDIIGREHTSKSMLLQNLNIEQGQSYTPAQLNQSFRRAYATLYYQYIYYELEPTSPGHCRLRCILQENELQQLKLALAYHSFSNASLMLNYTWRNLFLDKSVSSIKLAVGENWRIRFQHKQSFGSQLNNIADLSFRVDRLKMPIYNKASMSDMYRGYNMKFNLEYLRIKGIHWAMGGGTGTEMTYFEPDVVTPNQFKGSHIMPYAYLVLKNNTLDRRYLPTSGKLLNMKLLSGINRRINYTNMGYNGRTDTLYTPENPLLTFALQYESYRMMNPKTTLFAHLYAGYTQNNEKLIFDRIILGGIQPHLSQQVPFAGLLDAQLATTSVMAAGIGAHYRLIGDMYLIGRANTAAYGFRLPLGNEQSVAPKFITGFSLGTALNLSLLPMEFNIMYSPYINRIYSHVRVGFMF